jgi:peptide/nickel transport system substrate-binding protein
MELESPEQAKPVRAGSRRLLAIVAVIVVLLVVGGAAAYVVLTAPQPSKVLVVGTTDDEITFDPADAYDYFSGNLIQNTMAMLLTYVPGTTNLTTDLLSEVPSLANGGISSTELVYTLHLRANLKFEDGTPINSTVLKYSLDRVVKLNGEPAFLLGYVVKTQEYWKIPGDSANATRKDSAWKNYTAQGVQIVDPTTVKVTLRQKWSPFVSLLAFTITAPVDPKSLRDDKFYPNVIVASGPYRMSTYLPHQRYELTANPNYYGTPPKMSRVTIVRYTTAVDLKLAMKTGAIDIAYRSLLPPDFASFKTDTAVKTQEGDSPVIRYLVFNMCPAADVSLIRPLPADKCPHTTVFSDANGKLLRRALAYASDRSDISSSAYSGTIAPLYSLVPQGMFGHQDAFKTTYGASPNVAAAQALLTQAGFSTANKFTVKLWYTPSHYGDPEIFVAQSLKRAWEATGMVTVTLDLKAWTDYKAAWRAGDFDVFLLGWFPDYFDSDDYVFPFLHWASGGSASFGNWYHNSTGTPNMDALIEQQAATADLTTRANLFAQIQTGLAYDAPYIPLWQTKQTVVFKPTVSGIVLDPIQFFRYFTITVS